MSYARTSLKGLMYCDSQKTYYGFTLFTPADGEGAWFVDLKGKYVNRWRIPYRPCDAKILPNGNLLYAGKLSTGQLADLEGASGVLLEVDWNSNVVWEYKDPYLHHTFDRARNGNTYVLKWVKLQTKIAAKVKGGYPGTEREGVIWGDAIQEITPDGKVVWEWVGHEHIDPDSTYDCPICPRSTWTHTTAVSELPDGNLLVCFTGINTIAIIDKKTGNIKWQWGAWTGKDRGPGDLSHPHCPAMLDNGNILVFDNGLHPGGFAWGVSRILEINPRNNRIAWVYGGAGFVRIEFYSSVMGSCQRLPNGNTLICESTTGRIFEVTPSHETVWEFANGLPSYEPYPAQTRSHMVCTAYRYGVEYPGLKNPVSLPTEREPILGTTVPEEEAVKERLERLGY